MANEYKVKCEELTKIANNLKGIIEDYKTYKSRLSKLTSSISGSKRWIDKLNKTEFVKCLNGYIELYDNMHKGLSGYYKYIMRKVREAEEIESAFSCDAVMVTKGDIPELEISK